MASLAQLPPSYQHFCDWPGAEGEREGVYLLLAVSRVFDHVKCRYYVVLLFSPVPLVLGCEDIIVGGKYVNNL